MAAKHCRVDGPRADPDRAGALDLDQVLLELFADQLLLGRAGSAERREPGRLAPRRAARRGRPGCGAGASGRAPRDTEPRARGREGAGR